MIQDTYEDTSDDGDEDFVSGIDFISNLSWLDPLYLNVESSFLLKHFIMFLVQFYKNQTYAIIFSSNNSQPLNPIN